MAQEEIIFKISADSSDAEKDTKSLENSLEGVNEAAEQLMKTNKGLDASFEEVYGDIKPLSGRIGEMEDRMYELALANQQNTQEYKDLQAETARYRQVIISTDKSVDQLAEQGRGLGAALQIGTAVTAGYGAIQGSMIALGIESESLEKSFVKLQAVQTILASLEQLKLSLDKQSIVVTKAKAAATWVTTVAQTAWTAATAGTTTAMGVLNVVMMAMPIIAIIAGIIALVSVIASLFSATEEAEEMNNELNKSMEKSTELFERNSEAAMRNIDTKLRLAKAQKASSEEINKIELERLEQAEINRKRELVMSVDHYKKKKVIYRKALEEENEDLAKSTKDELFALKKKHRDLKALDGQYYQDRKILLIEQGNKLQEEEDKRVKESESKWKSANAKRKKAEEEARRLQLDRERLFSDLIIENIEDEETRKLTKLNEAHKRQQDDLIKKYGEDTMLMAQLEIKQGEEMTKLTKEFEEKRKLEQDKVDKEELDARNKHTEEQRRSEKARLEGELIALRDDFESSQAVKRELAEQELNFAILNTELTEGEKFKVKEEYALKISELDQAEADRKLLLEQQTADAVKNVYESSFGAISNLADGIFAVRIANAEAGSKKELELQKKAFKFNKAFQIAQATIQGIQAVQSTYATAAASPYGILNPSYPYIMASAAGVYALGNILKIKATSFQGGGSLGSTSTNPPSVSAPTDTETPEDTTTLTAGLDGTPQQGTNVTIVDSQIKQALMNSEAVEVISTVG